MSDEGYGKATMYVITEKGLEVGPFVYDKNTDSRVVCSNKRHIYHNHKGNESRIAEDLDLNSRKGFSDEKKLKVVDLGADSFPSDGISREFINRHVRDLENWGLMSGNFRNRIGLKSGKIRLNTAEQSNHENRPREEEDLDLEAIKRLLQSKKELDDLSKKASTPRKDIDMSLTGKRQLVLRRLRIKRQSEVLLEEIAKLREKRPAQLSHDREHIHRGSFLGKNKNIRFLKHVFYPNLRQSVDKDHGQSTHVQLPALQQSGVSVTNDNAQKSDQKEIIGTGHPSQRQQNNTSKRKYKPSREKLVFLSPRVQYNQSKAESSAKMNINESKVNNTTPKVRLPAVIDQRTGEMHSVPGVVAFRQSDYNKWSRRENIIRREILPTRSPSLTYVSFLPSVSGETKH